MQPTCRFLSSVIFSMRIFLRPTAEHATISSVHSVAGPGDLPSKTLGANTVSA